jgi:O-methyltransferase
MLSVIAWSAVRPEVVAVMNRSIVARIIRRMGASLPLPDVDQEALAIMRRVKPFTMTSPERLFSLIQAVRYVVRAGVPGSFVECGVWRGGSTMAAALTLLQLGRSDVKLHLFDTYEGMTAPSAADVDITGTGAAERFARVRTQAGSSWCHASLEDVQANIATTGYDLANVEFVKGRVEDTIPAAEPNAISVLRLDTDWYESTRHELIHLFPRLAPGGVLIIDDYGHWQGSKRATDEYFESCGVSILLNRVDYTGRIGVKMAAFGDSHADLRGRE